MTDYVILRKHPSGELELWQEVGSASASSPRRALAAIEAADGQYRAVPARSWKPLTVKVEQTVKVTIT